MAELKPGTIIKLKNAAFADAKIVRVLGEGGQGVVYEKGRFVDVDRNIRY
jgi:hypothetical protein